MPKCWFQIVRPDGQIVFQYLSIYSDEILPKSIVGLNLALGPVTSCSYQTA